jgi:Icc-related predicted phosphoesterase
MKKCLLSLALSTALWHGAFLGQAQSSRSASLTNSGLTLAPYIQALSPETVVVQWQTAQPAYGWVEYGASSALGRKQDAAVNGLKVANVTAHRITLARLRPGTSYCYRVAFKPIRRFGSNHVDFEPEEHSATATFQTLPGPDQPLRAVVFNDLHNQIETFKQLCFALDDTRFDFTIFNGDCLADPKTEPQVLTSLTAFTLGARAGTRPVFFLRGNHELRGACARELSRWLAWPEDKPYFAFSAGTVRFLVLDCGEDKPDNHPEYSGLADFDSFRRAETEWLKQELASSACRQAAWRVLVHHIPIHGGKKTAFCFPERESWAELLAKAQIDLALHGHTHVAAFHPAGTVGNPYPIAVGGGPQPGRAAVMVLEADLQHLKLRMLNAEGHDLFPVFEKIRPE